jgi:L-lysine exporter family protein LysE/ArgO
MVLAAAAAGFIASAGLIIAIGAQNAFVLRQGLKRQHVAVVVTLCALSDVVLILVGVAGIGVLIEQWPALLQALRFGGAGFLAFYGLMAARRAWRGHGSLTATSAESDTWQRVVLTCLAFTFLNPHVYLDTVVLLGSISTRYPGTLRWVFAFGACLASIAWFAMLGNGARLLQPVFRSARSWRVLDGAIAGFMFVLSLLLLLRPLR